jgi:two-component system, chemotaxis family, chemotaxis protein CheY
VYLICSFVIVMLAANGALPLDCPMPKRVLVVDDNPMIRRLICRLLEERAGYEVCAEASNGAEAIELAKQELPDLIILDLSMAVMNGIEAARELKKLFPHVPVIRFTQHADMAAHLSDLPVDRIVSKNDSATLLRFVYALAPV